jgi:hypothetical protein
MGGAAAVDVASVGGQAVCIIDPPEIAISNDAYLILIIMYSITNSTCWWNVLVLSLHKVYCRTRTIALQGETSAEQKFLPESRGPTKLVVNQQTRTLKCGSALSAWGRRTNPKIGGSMRPLTKSRVRVLQESMSL